jgi:hypothetical protein
VGDVRELLRKSDDSFVISKARDEITCRLLLTNCRRCRAVGPETFLFYGDGFSKEMDLNSASPDAITLYLSTDDEISYAHTPSPIR